MASITPFFERLKPALDTFLKISTPENLKRLENELNTFPWVQSKIVHIHVLLPLLLKLEELNGKNQELRTSIINCIRLVLSNVYLSEVKSFLTILTILLKQLRNLEKATTLDNLSEEIKLATLLCINTAFERSTTDVLEEFYTKRSQSLLGHILLFSVELIETEQYRKLKLAAIDCLGVAFYVHNKADRADVVLRSQVADTLFIYLPKIIGVLFKTSLADDKLGETLKAHAIKTLGDILHIIYEDTNEIESRKCYNSKEFKKLMTSLTIDGSKANANDESLILGGSRFKKDKVEQLLSRLQNNGRSAQWFRETSLRITDVLRQMTVLRSHPSHLVRLEFAKMCAKLIIYCAQNLKENYLILLENLIALAEDENAEISQLCTNTLKNLQQHSKGLQIFDESADTLFEQHGSKLLQIIHRKDEFELYAELLFLKGLLRNVDAKKLLTLFSLNSFMQHFCMTLILAVDLEAMPELLNEEYTLRQFDENVKFESSKLKWRRFKYLESERCALLLENICALLGSIKEINCLLFDYLFELLQNQTQRRMNEALLILTWMFAPKFAEKENTCKKQKISETKFADLILNEILNDIHWNLSLHPDAVSHLKVDKPSNWFVDRTPGLYESGYEIRVQDYDSDDEQIAEQEEISVTISDAQWNVLHTCMVLDALGHFANFMGLQFKKHIFRSLHKVLLKVASSNTMVYQAAIFALMSLQNALGYDNTTKFIENHTDYISYHLNMLLRRTPDSSHAVDILSVVLQLSSQRTLPHLENIFETLRNECSKTNQTQNISAYLRVFNAFLESVERWKISSEIEVATAMPQKEHTKIMSDSYQDILNNWLQILENTAIDFDESTANDTDNKESTSDNGFGANDSEINENCDNENTMNTEELPRHIQMVKELLQETLKFLSNSKQTHQIQSLECLIVGVPLLKDYENELLPLVHTIWQPLIEKFRQKDPLVLNRCFTLLNVLSTWAKDFILKRSLDDVIPYLKDFLKDSAAQSAVEHSNAQTQLYKLQLKLLQEFSNLITSMQIDNKFLNDIAEVIALYLSEKQPRELQSSAVQFFLDLISYNGPLIYLVAMKKINLKEFKQNVDKIMLQFHVF